MSYIRDHLTNIGQSITNMFHHPHFPGNSGWLSRLSDLTDNLAPSTEAPPDSDNDGISYSIESGNGWVRNHFNIEPEFNNYVHVKPTEDTNRLYSASKTFASRWTNPIITSRTETQNPTTSTTSTSSTSTTSTSTTSTTTSSVPTTSTTTESTATSKTASTTITTESEPTKPTITVTSTETTKVTEPTPTTSTSTTTLTTENPAAQEIRSDTEEIDIIDAKQLTELLVAEVTTAKVGQELPETTVKTISTTQEPVKTKITTAIRVRIDLTDGISSEMLDSKSRISEGLRNTMSLKLNSDDR